MMTDAPPEVRAEASSLLEPGVARGGAPSARHGLGPGPSGSTNRRLLRRAALAVVVVAGAIGGAASVDQPPAPLVGDLVASDGVGHIHGPISDEALARLDASGYDLLPGPDDMWSYTAPQPDVAPIDGPDLLAEVQRVVDERGWEDLAAGERDGFAQISEVSDDQHWFHRGYLDDGISVDPERPESLVYDLDGRLLAVMFMVPLDEHGPPVADADTAWHVHAVSMCFGSDAMMPTVLADDGRCPSGERYADWSAEMLHVWMEGEPFAQRMGHG